MARDKELLPRDLYDIVVARQRDPAALQIALDALRNDQLGEILEAFKDHPARARPQDHSSVLAPSDPVLNERSPAALPPPRFKSLRTLGGISLYEMARALHITRNRRNTFVRWINRFAVRPEPAP